MLRHVVMIKLRDGCDAKSCHQLVLECARHIPDVRGISCGFDTAGLSTSYDYCFTLDFDDAQGLRNYEASAYHQLIRQEIRRIRTVSHTVDYLE